MNSLVTDLPAEAAGQWEASAAAHPGELHFLRPEIIAEYAQFCGLPDTHLDGINRAACRIEHDPALKALAWHCYWVAFLGPGGGRFGKWPTFEAELDDDAGIFYLLAGLGMVPLILEHHRKLGVPEKITRQTAGQIACFCANYERGHGGRLGIYPNQFGWLRHYIHEKYFRLGRMEYWLKPFRGGVRAYRHRRYDRVLALAEPGKVFDRDGFIQAGLSQDNLPAGSWLSSLERRPQSVMGQIVSPMGHALPRTVELALDDWAPVLEKNTWVLDMHIPPGGGLSPEACRNSHLEAVAFFNRHFPEADWKAFVCNSWMFNTQLERILPASANLVRYQQDLYLFPVPSTGQDGFWFIFLQESVDPDTAPAETSLQRSILDFLRAGNRWRGGGMFLLREHAHATGLRIYRSSWPRMEFTSP